MQSPARILRQFRQAALLCLALSPLLPTAAQAAAADPQGLIDQGRMLLEERAASSAQAVGGRVEITVSEQAAARVAAAPCPDPEVFLPPGGLALGKSSFGLRCAGTAWQLRVPADVALYAQVPVAVHALAAGAPVAAGDLVMAEVNLGTYPRGLVTGMEQVAGGIAMRPVAAGAPIPIGGVQSPDHMSAGSTVQVLLTGDGFTVKAAGKLLGPTNPGQTARVQLDNGRTVTGTMRAGREVEVSQ